MKETGQYSTQAACAAGLTELVGIFAEAYTARCLHTQASDLLDTYR